MGIAQKKQDKSIDSEIQELINKRQQARKEKDWNTADEIRDRLKDMGIILEDTPQGVKWSFRKIKNGYIFFGEENMGEIL